MQMIADYRNQSRGSRLELVRFIPRTLHWVPLATNKNMPKETARSKQGNVVTELFNIAVHDSDAKKAACYSQVLVVSKLVASRTVVYNKLISSIQTIDNKLSKLR